MIAAPINHVVLDERGVAYIRGTTLKVAHIAVDSVEWGMAPQQIRDNYPQLSLAQIHAALAYYHDHQEQMDAWIAQETEEYERLRAEHPNPITREQWEERRQQQERGEPAE
jgi:uncharacterized protein (DUF433 family)